MRARTRLWLDIGTFVALLTAYNPAWTGLSVHEWLSIAVIVPLLLHFVLNWEWTVRISLAFLDRLIHTSRLNLIVDTTLFVSTVAVMLSGLMVSQVVLRAMGIAIMPSAVWVALHTISADMTIVLLATHFALHANWFARTLGIDRLATAAQPAGSRLRHNA